MKNKNVKDVLLSVSISQNTNKLVGRLLTEREVDYVSGGNCTGNGYDQSGGGSFTQNGGHYTQSGGSYDMSCAK